MSERHHTALKALHQADRKARHDTMEAAYGIAMRADKLERNMRWAWRKIEVGRDALHAVGELLAAHECECECEFACEPRLDGTGHQPECRPCLKCRIDAVVYLALKVMPKAKEPQP